MRSVSSRFNHEITRMGIEVLMENKEEVKVVNHFAELAAINVTQNVEKKNGMSYLSWSWAVNELMRQDPQANWTFRQPVSYPDGTMMVHCDVIAFGKSMYMWLPVMDHKNKAIQNPNAVEINKAMMRCLVKGIAVHGLGLYIYAGEDLPEEEKQAIQQQRQQAQQQRQQAQQAQQTQYPSGIGRTDAELTQDLQVALEAIHHAPDEDELKRAFYYFQGTKHEQAIVKACQAKKDREGWSE